VRVWERGVRRAELPVRFTEGFSPRPRLRFGPALPTCFASTAEYIDIDFADDMTATPDDVAARLDTVLPVGMDVIAAVAVDDRAAALQATIMFAEYLVPLHRAPDGFDVDAAIERVLAAASLPGTVVRKGKEVDVDVRPGLDALASFDPAAPPPRVQPDLVAAFAADFADLPVLWMRLASQPRSVRPAEVLAHLGDGVAEYLSHRTAQLCIDGSELTEPVTVSSVTHPDRATASDAVAVASHDHRQEG
jgi:radical SAM-linked protein